MINMPIDYTQKIGNHHLSMFCYSDIAKKTVEPTEDQLNHLKWLCRDILDKVEGQFGNVSITQGIRDMEVHKLLKERWLQDQERPPEHRIGYGKPSASSWHLSGDAVDFMAPNLVEIFGWMVANELPMRECRLYNSHIHVARFDRHFMKIKDLS